MLGGELSGSFEKLIITALQANQETFDPDYHTEAKMKEDVERLYKMGQGIYGMRDVFIDVYWLFRLAHKRCCCLYYIKSGQWGTDETSLFKLLCSAPPQYLSWINTSYTDKYGATIPALLEKELSGSTKKAAVYLALMKLKPFEAVARLVKSACAGFGTNEYVLFIAILLVLFVESNLNASNIINPGCF